MRLRGSRRCFILKSDARTERRRGWRSRLATRESGGDGGPRRRSTLSSSTAKHISCSHADLFSRTGSRLPKEFERSSGWWGWRKGWFSSRESSRETWIGRRTQSGFFFTKFKFPFKSILLSIGHAKAILSPHVIMQRPALHSTADWINGPPLLTLVCLSLESRRRKHHVMMMMP